MSTIQRVNFEPVSDVLPLCRRDFVLADPTLADPTDAAVLVDGEWVILDTSYRILRAASISSAGNAATVRSFPLWAERGRYDVQALSGRKMPVVWLGESEWDTRVYDATATVGSGAQITAIMQPLKVASITIGSRKYTGLVGHGGANDTNPVVGYVTKLPSGGKLRFRTGYRS